MKRIFLFVLSAALVPVASAAQEDPTERLSALLPDEVSARVLEHIDEARAGGLPTNPIATLALEGVVKGRSGEEVLAAVEALATDMTRARAALSAAERGPEDGEIEAATAAMRMGVDGATISDLARSQPSGRTLAVPMLVLGSLVDGGLPSVQAIAAVRDRLEAGASDAELLGDFQEVGRALGQGMDPADRGAAMRQGFAGVQIPVAGVPVSIPAQGRGRGPGDI